MDFWKWILFSFTGRISRKYYWYTILIFWIVSLVWMGGVYGVNAEALAEGNLSPMVFICLLPLYILLIYMGLAVSIKRWHDRGKSGWWVLIGLVPIIGGLWVLIECGFLSGTDGENQYGLSNIPPSATVASSTSVAASAPPPVDPTSTTAPDTVQDTSVAPDIADVQDDENPYSP